MIFKLIAEIIKDASNVVYLTYRNLINTICQAG
jgi:hypothetical protein